MKVHAAESGRYDRRSNGRAVLPVTVPVQPHRACRELPMHTSGACTHVALWQSYARAQTPNQPPWGPYMPINDGHLEMIDPLRYHILDARKPSCNV